MKPNEPTRDAESAAMIAASVAGALLTIEDVARLLKVPPTWVYEKTRRRAKRGYSDPLPGFRIGKYWRFRECDVLAWLERQRTGARPIA